MNGSMTGEMDQWQGPVTARDGRGERSGRGWMDGWMDGRLRDFPRRDGKQRRGGMGGGTKDQERRIRRSPSREQPTEPPIGSGI